MKQIKRILVCLFAGCMLTACAGTKKYKGFLLDNVLHSKEDGDIHYNVYIPDDYNGSKAYALFMTLPGYQGLYFQGVGENIKTENVGFTAQEYNPEMIIVAPQLDDWGETGIIHSLSAGKFPVGWQLRCSCKKPDTGISGGW